MKFGDTIRIEMKGKDGQSLFGAIDQRIAPLAAASDAARQPGPSSAPASIRA
jgi:hypothetical protein